MTIIVNGEEFSENDALKAIKKAKRERIKQEKIDTEEREKALQHSQIRLAVLVHYLEQKNPDKPVENISINPCIPTKKDKYWVQQYQCGGYIAHQEHCGYKPVYTIKDYYGDVAVLLQNDEEMKEWYTIGIHNTKIAFFPIPNFISVFFNPLIDCIPVEE